MKTRTCRQGGSTLMIVLVAIVFIGLLLAALLKIQSGATKEAEVAKRENLADDAISFCYAEAETRFSQIESSSYDLLLQPTAPNNFPDLKKCSLVKLDDVPSAEELSIESCEGGAVNPNNFKYYELVALVQFVDGVKVETRSIVSDNPCINASVGWML